MSEHIPTSKCHHEDPATNAWPPDDLLECPHELFCHGTWINALRLTAVFGHPDAKEEMKVQGIQVKFKGFNTEF